MSNLNDFVRELYTKSKESMQWWVDSLEATYSKNISPISSCIYSLEKFFGEELKENMKLIVLTSGSTDDIQGSPMSNYTESNSPYFKDIIELKYDIEMFFSLIDDENNGRPIQSVESVLSSILHEAIHKDLQREPFFKLIEEVERDSEIKKVERVLKENSGSYMDITMELITQYVTSYIEHCIRNNVVNSYCSERSVLEFVQNYDVFEKLISSNILNIVKHERLDGAFSRLFTNHINLVGYVPEEVREEYDTLKRNDKGKGDWRENSLNIYKMAYRFDLELVTEYMSKGKKIDELFIRNMYELVKREI